jgi:hypothetical protein
LGVNVGVLNNTGYAIKTYAEWKALVDAAYTSAWAGIDLSAQSSEGIEAAQLAEWLTEADQDGLGVFNSFNLNNATGAVLSFIAILRGTSRRIGTKALFTVTLTSSLQPYSILAGTQFKLLDTELLFNATAQINIAALSTTGIEIEAAATGITVATAGDKLSSIITISALTDIAITSVTEGTADESDEDLRIRLRSVNSISSSSDVDAIYSALRNLANTTKVRVYDNDTGSTDANGVLAGYINCVVLGSTTQEIVDVIRGKKPAGTPTQGSSSGISVDGQGYNKIQYFDRPSKVNYYIAASVTKKSGQSQTDRSYDDIIKLNTQSYVNDVDIGNTPSMTLIRGLFTFPAFNEVTSVPISPFDIYDLRISKISASAGFAASCPTIGVREYASVDSVNDISITEI